MSGGMKKETQDMATNCKTVELEDSSFKNYGKHQARLNTIQSQAAAKSLNHTELPETL